MNPFSAILVLIVSLAQQIFAAETKHTYIGQITGVVCATCEAHISAALIAKLPGMEKIDITKGEKRRHEYDHHRFQGRGCHQGHGHVSARRPIQNLPDHLSL